MVPVDDDGANSAAPGVCHSLSFYVRAGVDRPNLSGSYVPHQGPLGLYTFSLLFVVCSMLLVVSYVLYASGSLVAVLLVTLTHTNKIQNSVISFARLVYRMREPEVRTSLIACGFFLMRTRSTAYSSIYRSLSHVNVVHSLSVNAMSMYACHYSTY